MGGRESKGGVGVLVEPTGRQWVKGYDLAQQEGAQGGDPGLTQTDVT